MSFRAVTLSAVEGTVEKSFLVDTNCTNYLKVFFCHFEPTKRSVRNLRIVEISQSLLCISFRNDVIVMSNLLALLFDRKVFVFYKLSNYSSTQPQSPEAQQLPVVLLCGQTYLLPNKIAFPKPNPELWRVLQESRTNLQSIAIKLLLFPFLPLGKQVTIVWKMV